MAERKKILLRLDPDVYAAIARWAGDDLRSVNSQIEFALRQALRAVNRPVRQAEAESEDKPEPELEAEPGEGPEDKPGDGSED